MGRSKSTTWRQWVWRLPANWTVGLTYRPDRHHFRCWSRTTIDPWTKFHRRSMGVEVPLVTLGIYHY